VRHVLTLVKNLTKAKVPHGKKKNTEYINLFIMDLVRYMGQLAKIQFAFKKTHVRRDSNSWLWKDKKG